MKRTWRFTLAGIFIATFVVGCTSDYGKIRTVEKGGMTIEALVSNWSFYNIYYAGTKAEEPVCLLFDPKDDGKTVNVSPKWEKVRNETSVQQMVHFIRMQTGQGLGTPTLWKVLGPDDSLYGYAYILFFEPIIRSIDQNTIMVDYPG
jgi:hypothetical protein